MASVGSVVLYFSLTYIRLFFLPRAECVAVEKGVGGGTFCFHLILFLFFSTATALLKTKCRRCCGAFLVAPVAIASHRGPPTRAPSRPVAVTAAKTQHSFVVKVLKNRTRLQLGNHSGTRGTQRQPPDWSAGGRPPIRAAVLNYRKDWDAICNILVKEIKRINNTKPRKTSWKLFNFDEIKIQKSSQFKSK